MTRPTIVNPKNIDQLSSLMMVLSILVMAALMASYVLGQGLPTWQVHAEQMRAEAHRMAPVSVETVQAKPMGDGCRTVEVNLDEGYGVSRRGLQTVCDSVP